MVWHLPHIRAIAVAAAHPVTLMTKPRSAADQIFVAENTISEILWMDRNPGRRRGAHDGMIGLLRLIATLRKHRFDTVVILHHSRTLAFATMAAGIPRRHGYGYRWQRPFLNCRPYLPQSALKPAPLSAGYRVSARSRDPGRRIGTAAARLGSGPRCCR